MNVSNVSFDAFGILAVRHRVCVMKKSQLSLKWLEVFQLIAQGGSVQGAADEAGLSVSTVSHHLRNLEDTLGTSLFDHSRRPMRLTPSGAVFLRDIDEAMRLLRKAENEAQSGTLTETRNLALAVVEDFDSEIAPELARALASGMPNCAFRHLTRPSHEILNLLRNQEVDIGVAARPQFDQSDLIEYPLLRDPFVLAVPAARAIAAETYLEGAAPLPLLRYSHDQIIGNQVEAQLRRLRLSIPNRFEFESNQSIMSMVAEDNGWAITTPTNYIRAHRFHRQITLMPFPAKGFARHLSVFTTELHPSAAAETVAGTLRHLLQSRAIDPTVARMPWLHDAFCLMPDRDVSPES